MTIAEYAAMLLREFDADAVMVMRDHMGFTRLASACKVANTEYLMPPVGVPKVMVVPE